jgi:uncharacterized protein (AIM24 family)
VWPLVQADVRLAGGCATVCVGGEGIFNTVLKGPGLVILESMSVKKLRKLFTQPPKKSRKNRSNPGGSA